MPAPAPSPHPSGAEEIISVFLCGVKDFPMNRTYPPDGGERLGIEGVMGPADCYWLLGLHLWRAIF